MFQEASKSKSDSDRPRQSTSDTIQPTANTAGGGSTPAAGNAKGQQKHHQNDEMQNKTSYSVNKQQMAASALHQHYLNYFNSNIPKEETKSHQRTRSSSIFNSQDQHQSQMSYPNAAANQRANHNIGKTSGNNNSTYVYHIPSQIYNYPSSHQQAHYVSSNSNMPRSAPKDESPMAQRYQQQHQPPQSQMKSRTHSTGALYPQIPQPSQQTTSRPVPHNNRHLDQAQQDRDSEETTATIKEELENDLQGCKTSELEAISSLERNLPIELSFLIRQQAHCMARMNYLDRQIRELKDVAQQSQQQVESNHVSSTSILNQGHMNRPASNTATTVAPTKNGNFILSDDSGGEYSRATISDDDELSSLLDQIAKSVRPERGSAGGVASSSMISNNYGHPQQQLQQQQQQRLMASCGPLMGNQHQQQHQQPYAIINPNQLHHQQAVPIFVMGSPIAVAHPSSINSNILPGVHFQPEPRYNQYYEDFYYGNTGVASSMVNTPTAAMQRHGPGQRSQQFDNSISVIEQLVSQKEKRQIISQLKSADNWLKMRSSNADNSLRAANKQPSMSKQLSAEAGVQDEEAIQSGDKKASATATPSSSTMHAGGD